MSGDNKEYVIHMEVRDYECDMADGVNNSVYFNYLEHARHSMLKEGGIDFAELARKRIGLVVLKAELDFVRSLMSGDRFSVRSRLFRRSKIRFEFLQDIYRDADNQLMLRGKILGVSVGANGRPSLPTELESLIIPMCSETPDEVHA